MAPTRNTYLNFTTNWVGLLTLTNVRLVALLCQYSHLLRKIIYVPECLSYNSTNWSFRWMRTPKKRASVWGIPQGVPPYARAKPDAASIRTIMNLAMKDLLMWKRNVIA